MATMEILDRLGATQVVEKPLPPGPAADTASRPVALSTQDRALLGATNEVAPASDTATAGHSGRLQKIAQNISSLTNAVTSALTGVILSTSSAIIGKVKLVDVDGVDLVFVKSSVATGQIPIGTSAQPLMGPNANRMHAQCCINHATIKGYWGQTNAVTLTTGHLIPPGVPHDFDGYLGAVYIIADASATATFEEW